MHQLDSRFSGLRARHPQRERQLLADLAENGQRLGLVVVQDIPGRFTIIDGHKRLRAAQKLGWDQLDVLVWDLSPADALVHERVQRAGEGDCPLEQGWLLRELADSYGMSLETLAVRFGKSKSWVSRRLALVQVLPPQITHAVANGTLSAYATEKYLVPLARANAAYAERVALAVAGKGLSVRDIGTVVAAYQGASTEQRDRLLDDPKLYIKALEASQSTASSQDTPHDSLRIQLARLAANLGRAQQSLLEHAPQLDDNQRQALYALIAGISQATALLISMARKEINYVGPQHPDCDSQAA